MKPVPVKRVWITWIMIRVWIVPVSLELGPEIDLLGFNDGVWIWMVVHSICPGFDESSRHGEFSVLGKDFRV